MTYDDFKDKLRREIPDVLDIEVEHIWTGFARAAKREGVDMLTVPPSFMDDPVIWPFVRRRVIDLRKLERSNAN